METKELEEFGVPKEHQSKLSELIKTEIAKAVEGAQNDADFIQKIKSEEAGKFYNSVERKLKSTFGVDLDSIDKELSGLKRFEEILKVGISTLEKSKDSTNQELQQKYLDLQANFDKFKEEDHVNAINEVKSKYNGRLVASKMLEDSSEIRVTCAEHAKVPQIELFLSKNGYKAVWDEDKQDYEFWTKDNLKPTKDGKSLSKKEIITNAFEYMGVLEKSNGGTRTPEGGVEIKVPNGTKFSDAAIRRAQEAGVTLPA